MLPSSLGPTIKCLQKQVQLQVVPIFQTEKILLTELLHLLHLPYPYREIVA